MDRARRWLDGRAETGGVFYVSVDIRRGGGRICPVDVNVFPAGFNNLSPADAQRLPAHFRAALESRGWPPDSAVGIIAESHTRNPYYAEHLHALVGAIRKAGFRAEISCPECADDVTVISASGESLKLLPFSRRGALAVFGADFIPDVLLLNNDLASGLPLLLKGLAQPMIPDARYGWYARRKHRLFEIYDKLADEICRTAQIDPRGIRPLSLAVTDVDFKQRSGLDRIAQSVETVLAESRRWNESAGVSGPPVAVIKSNYGTYGMAVMSVSSAAEVLTINRKTVNKMHVGKGKVQTSEILVQEGIPTDDLVDGCPAEPVIYLVDGRPVGAFYRHHGERGNSYNLNVTGMSFKPICLTDVAESDGMEATVLVARLAALAAAMERAG